MRAVPGVLGLCLMLAGGGWAGRGDNTNNCPSLKTVNIDLQKLSSEQPFMVNFLPKTETVQLVDNACYTIFPLPDDPHTMQVYFSVVFCDGSYDVTSLVATDHRPGLLRTGNPYVMSEYSFIAYAGCDTYLVYQCDTYGEGSTQPFVFGVSTSREAIGLSCVRKVDDMLSDHGLPTTNFYALPMKLPNRCVTQQLCINPSANNQFYKSLGLSGPLRRRK